MRIRGCAFLMLAATLPERAIAQALQPWPTIYVNAPVGGGVLASGELIGRAARSDERPSQLEARLQVGHALSKRLTAWVGYVHVATYNLGHPAGIEDQAVEQVDWTIVGMPRLRLSSRTRIEQRSLRGDDMTAWRLREQVRAAMALGRGATPQAVVWVEPFVSLNQTALVRQTFDQLRVFAGLGLSLDRRTSIEVGYLRQHLHRVPLDVDNDVVPVILSMRF